MEKDFDIKNIDAENIDFSKLSKENMEWLLLLLIFVFAANEDKEKYNKLKEKFEKEIEDRSDKG